MKALSKKTLVALTISLGLSGSAWSMGNIDNTALINGGGGSFYPPGIGGGQASIGETFTTDASSSTLLGFSISVRSLFPTPGSFREYVGLWNGTGISSILWTSSPISFSAYPPAVAGVTYGFYELEASPALTLAPNTAYIAFYSAQDFPQPPDHNFNGGLMPLFSDGAVPGGDAVFSNDPLTSSGIWGNFDRTGLHFNFAFEADFAPVTSPVPEPETYALLLAGLGFLGYVARRKSFKK